VLRTYDRLNHIALGHIARAETSPGSLIHQTWAALMAQLPPDLKPAVAIFC
jgi:hypothetical protein